MNKFLRNSYEALGNMVIYLIASFTQVSTVFIPQAILVVWFIL
ncbi:hypothetical protein [Gracilibacillus phocaeensis]|nr:hypothetical protein [Gracilibacillus phocaeensis]